MSTEYHTPQPLSTSGIYRIVNTVNGKFYIGSSIDLRGRRNDHFAELKRNIHINTKLQHAWNKYGEDAFVFEVLELVLPHFLIEREQYWLDHYMPFGVKGYNINTSAASRLGMKHTHETREKISQSRQGIEISPEHREKLRIANLGNTRALGNKLSPETRAKMSEARMGNTFNVGRKLSPEHRKKIGDAQRGRKASPESVEKRKGLKHTPEARAKMSQAMQGNKNALGRTVSPETREKISHAHVGRKQAPETIEKHRQSMLGRTYDSEVYTNRMKTYILTSPDGVEYEVVGIRKFAREHNLNNSHLIRVAKGEYSQHKGWKARYAD